MFKIKFTSSYLVITRKDLVITRKFSRNYEKRSRNYEKNLVISPTYNYYINGDVPARSSVEND